ncbi:MAG: hypothetical protein ABIN91_11450 [Mucilaginibacter sp.]|uniref:hypothetical protein n=1 Tax=Mucilaginibacter sp. TaxID=1882438 RepID=UPI003267D74C
MRYFVIVILLFITSTAFAQRSNCDSIVWSSFHKLTWADYKARPVAASRIASLTHFSFVHSWHVDDNVLIAQVICIFNPCQSWTKNNQSAELLEHEQAHFDIAEYFRRVYNKRISHERYTPTTLPLITLKTYVDIQLECARMEDAYDEETNHGLNQSSQREWITRVGKLLASVEEYDKVEMRVNLNR